MADRPIDVIKDFVGENSLVDFADGSVADDTDLFVTGVLDSFGMMKLVQHLESTFRIKFKAQDFASPLMATIGGMVSIVEGRRQKT